MTTLNSGNSVAWFALIRRCRSVLPGKRLELDQYEAKLLEMTDGVQTLLNDVGVKGASVVQKPDGGRYRSYFEMPAAASGGVDTDQAIASNAADTIPSKVVPAYVQPVHEDMEEMIADAKKYTRVGGVSFIRRATVERLDKQHGLIWRSEFLDKLGSEFSVESWEGDMLTLRRGEWYQPLGDHVLRLNNALNTIRALPPGGVYAFDYTFVRLLNEFVGDVWKSEVKKALGDNFTLAAVNDTASVQRTKVEPDPFWPPEPETEANRHLRERAAKVDHLPEHPEPNYSGRMTLLPLGGITKPEYKKDDRFERIPYSESYPVRPRREPPVIKRVPWHEQPAPQWLLFLAGAVCMFVLLAVAGLLR